MGGMDDNSRSPGCLWPTLAFVGTLALGLVVTVLVVRSMREVPHPTEAYEGFGDAAVALLRLLFGAGLSILIALFTGIFVAVRVGRKVEAEQREPRVADERGGQSGSS
jgi:hypothetical protein